MSRVRRVGWTGNCEATTLATAAASGAVCRQSQAQPRQVGWPGAPCEAPTLRLLGHDHGGGRALAGSCPEMCAAVVQSGVSPRMRAPRGPACASVSIAASVRARGAHTAGSRLLPLVTGAPRANTPAHTHKRTRTHTRTHTHTHAHARAHTQTGLQKNHRHTESPRTTR